MFFFQCCSQIFFFGGDFYFRRFLFQSFFFHRRHFIFQGFFDKVFFSLKGFLSQRSFSIDFRKGFFSKEVCWFFFLEFWFSLIFFSFFKDFFAKVVLQTGLSGVCFFFQRWLSFFCFVIFFFF